MKQKDIALIIIIAALSGGLALVASQFLFATPQNQQQTVAQVDPITTDFTSPDPKFFNAQSINPAKLIEVGNGNNTNPFNGSGH
jgi:hypothetical protein